MGNIDDKKLAMLCVTIIAVALILFAVFRPITQTMQSILLPIITGLLGAAIGRLELQTTRKAPPAPTGKPPGTP